MSLTAAEVIKLASKIVDKLESERVVITKASVPDEIVGMMLQGGVMSPEQIEGFIWFCADIATDFSPHHGMVPWGDRLDNDQKTKLLRELQGRISADEKNVDIELKAAEYDLWKIRQISQESYIYDHDIYGIDSIVSELVTVGIDEEIAVIIEKRDELLKRAAEMEKEIRTKSGGLYNQEKIEELERADEERVSKLKEAKALYRKSRKSTSALRIAVDFGSTRRLAAIDISNTVEQKDRQAEWLLKNVGVDMLERAGVKT